MSKPIDIHSATGWSIFTNKIFSNKDVWVEFINRKHKRFGSIGVIRGVRSWRPSQWSFTKTPELVGTLYVDFPNIGKTSIPLWSQRWELSKNIQMLDGYTGPAVRINATPPIVPPKQLLDMHGVEIEIGSFCAFNSGNRLVFGSVSAISQGGVVFLNRVNGSPTKILKISNLAVINEDFRDMMMIRKLAA